MKEEKAKCVSVRKLYDVWAENYDRQNNLLFFLEEQITRKLFNFRGKDILDLGCGSGRYAIPLARKNKLVAVDFNKKMLDIAREKAERDKVKINFVQEEVTKFKPARKFDTKKILTSSDFRGFRSIASDSAQKSKISDMTQKPVVFDIIISMMVQDQVKDLEKVGKVIFSASKKGTEVFISNVHPTKIYEILSKGKSEIIPGYLINEYYHPLGEYLKIFRKLGFELVDYWDIIFEKKYFNVLEAPKVLRNKPLGVLYHFMRVR
jgi:2-polyprenyl-3-methyl-5-hydroxy-6-metoxy-1,4-benzoquinol methylase